jgi:oligopeptide/dipeptide ABC transporter ATP-binding protein
MSALLQIQDLETHFESDMGTVKAVDGVSYDVEAGETLAVVGESGCGKSVTALSVMRLIPNPPGRIVGGQILYKGKDLLTLSNEEMRKVRGQEIGMIFQEPMTSLNPVMSIGKQLMEPLIKEMGMTKQQAHDRATELLSSVEIPDPARRLSQYPHHFSGGMRQRVMIAMALSCDPSVLIADEPTTALDVTVQAQILELMKQLTKQRGVALVIITHNLGVVARYADRVNVMYAGRVVERSSARSVYGDPRHPYTLGLMRSVPRLDHPTTEDLEQINGQPPNLAALGQGCAFQERCRFAIDKCAEERPELAEAAPDHYSACFVASELGKTPTNQSQASAS